MQVVGERCSDRYNRPRARARPRARNRRPKNPVRYPCPRLAGSRFAGLKVYRIAASGSREQPCVRQVYRVRFKKTIAGTLGDGRRRVILGSRLLPKYRASVRQSGSPPDVGRASP
jgi:hypothetical protein